MDKPKPICSPLFQSWGHKKANQTLGFLRRNIKVHNQDLKATAYKTLMRPQLEYASSVWSPNTTEDIDKIESAQRRVARLATRDYQQTSSITEMLGKLHWRPLDQRRIDNRLIMFYKITYDLVAIPVAENLVPSHRESKFIHPLAYKQIHTSTNYYKFGFFPRSIVHWNALPTSIVMLPTLVQFSYAVCQVVHESP